MFEINKHYAYMFERQKQDQNIVTTTFSISRSLSPWAMVTLFTLSPLEI